MLNHDAGGRFIGGAKSLAMAVVAFCGMVVSSYAMPTIGDLKVTPIEPWGLAIDYAVSGATTNDLKRPFNVSFVTNGVTNVAKSLMGATNCVNGAHRVYWNMAKDGIALGQTNLTITVSYRWPRYCVIDLSGGSSAVTYPVAYLDAPPSGGFNTTEYKTTKLVLRRVDAGSFTMQNTMSVTLTKPFYMGLYETTQRQWTLVTGVNKGSSYGNGYAYPVYYVSYNDIRGPSSGTQWPATNVVDSDSFLGKLRTRTELDFDLPTEAQWEYTCRAGTTTTYGYGDSANGDYMWYSSNASSTHEVGTKLPNDWGFYDMHGNVWEWCLDWYGTLTAGTDPVGPDSGSYRVKRGGSWYYNADYCTSSGRDGVIPSGSYNEHGFRLSWTLSDDVQAEADLDSAAASAEVAVQGVCTNGSPVEDVIEIGYAPDGDENAVVSAGGIVATFAGASGTFKWQPLTNGTQKLSHMVGTNELAVSLTSTNGSACLPDGAFAGCASLVTIKLPSGLKSIGAGAFTGCSNLKRVDVPTLADWYGLAFADEEANPLSQGASLSVAGVPVSLENQGEVVVAEGVTNLPWKAFADCTNLVSIALPSSLSTLPENAFAGCTNLSSLSLAAACTNYASCAGLTSLTNLVLEGPFGLRRKRCQLSESTTWTKVSDAGNETVYRSASIGHNSSTAITFTIPVGTLSVTYSWKVSSEANCDRLTAYLAGSQINQISGEQGWTTVTLELDGMAQTLRFVYSKDGSVVRGSDCGWISVKADTTPLEPLTEVFPDSPLSTVTLGDDWTSVPERFFSDCSNLVSVVLSESIVEIGDGAFEGCSSLETIRIPSAVTLLGDRVFDGCTSLVEINIPSAMTDLGDNDFREIGVRAGREEGLWVQDGWVLGYIGTAPAKVVIPEGVKGIAPYAFDDQIFLEKVTFPSSLVSVGAYAFRRCTSLGDIVLPEGVVCVDDGAFQDCTYAETLTVPSTLRRVGNTAFANMTSLDEVAFAAGLDEIGAAAFSNDWRMVSASIPVSVTNIGANAFWNCKSLTDVTTPTHLQPLSSLFPAAYSSLSSIVVAEGETTLVTNVFAGCAAIETVILPDAVESIPTSAFENCTALKSIDIPAAVTNIGSRAFSNCAAVRSVTIPGGIKTLANVFPSSYTKLTSVTITTNTTALVASFLEGCSSLPMIEIPSSVTNIGARACYGLTALTEVVIPDGVTTIGSYAFGNCAAIRSVTIPGGICSLSSVFSSAYTQLTSVTITTNTTNLADSFLSGCTSLSTIEIPAAVTNIGASALSGCSKISSIEFPDGLQSIGANACYGMSSLTEVVIPGGVTAIGSSAFAYCSLVRRVTMPGDVCRVCDAFSTGYASLVEVNVTPDTTRLVDGFFYGCSSLIEVGLPDGVTEMGTGVFCNCTKLTQVALPDGLTALPGETFANCTALTSVVVPASVTNIGTKVFSNCTSLKSVQFLGDAPSVAEGAYTGAATDLVTYVQAGTYGWDGIASSRALPETWPGDASNAIATWTPTKIVVSFDAQGGEPAKTSLVNIVDTTYRLPQTEPMRRGATFAGWWSEVVAGAQVRPTTRVVLTSGHTFYAHWRFHEYEIAFDANGGDGEMASVARTVGDGEVALPSVSFRRTDFDFAGWATEPDGEIVFADGAAVGDLAYDDGAVVTLYAVWTARTWTTDDYLGVSADDGVVFGGADEQPWTPDRETSHDGNGSMRSGTIGAADVGDTRETTMTATVVGEGMVSFWWKTSCEPADEEGTFFDYASFAVDGVTVAQIAGETDWAKVTQTITGAGAHVLAWTFTRDDYDEDETLYENAAWVDELTWERSSVVVSFDLGGVEGETPAAVTNVAGYALKLPDVSALGGAAKRFVGWSDGSSVYVAGATYLFGSADVTLTAQWEEKTWTLAEAVDVDAQLGLAFTTGGDAEWVVDFATNKVGEASARSGAITHSQTTWMETTVTGAGELRFWMKVCGERYRNKDCDVGTCSVDGATVYSSATNDWTNVVVSIEGAGAHTIRWVYTKNASRSAVYDCAWMDGVTWTPSSVVPAVPSVLGDASATVTGDATSGWTVAPSEGVSSVEVTIPEGVDAAKVTVEVGADVAAVTPHGAKVKVVRGGHDITDYLDVPSADAAGSIDLTKATVKEAVVKEAMDPEKGAKFEVKASEPTLTTSATKPGLTYTLREGTTLDGMSDGMSKLGDGSSWTPEITVKGGSSGFYSIKVTK